MEGLPFLLPVLPSPSCGQCCQLLCLGTGSLWKPSLGTEPSLPPGPPSPQRPSGSPGVYFPARALSQRPAGHQLTSSRQLLSPAPWLHSAAPPHSKPSSFPHHALVSALPACGWNWSLVSPRTSISGGLSRVTDSRGKSPRPSVYVLNTGAAADRTQARLHHPDVAFIKSSGMALTLSTGMAS